MGHRLRTSLWVIPLIGALVGIALSFVTAAIDRATEGDLLPVDLTGDPNAALVVLSTVAVSMVSLIALVLTITSVVVQLAMGQFSPRSVRPFLQDRPSQIAIGVFVGTFAHAMIAMREVQSFSRDGWVPGITIVVAYVLIIVSIVVLVAYVHHIGSSLKVDSIVKSVGEETRAVVDRIYTEIDPSMTNVPADDVVCSDRAGSLFRVDHDALVDIAARADVELAMVPRVGSFVPEGGALFRVAGDRAAVDDDDVRRAVAIGPERTMDQDATFGIQTLVDIAERSLTDEFSDETTAAQVIDRIHDIFRQLLGRRFPDGRHRDGDGVLRLTVPELGWPDLVALALDPLERAAASSPAATDRLRAALEDLCAAAARERRQPIEERLARLDARR